MKNMLKIFPSIRNIQLQMNTHVITITMFVNHETCAQITV